MKTRAIRNKNCRNFSRNWLSAVKFAETRRIRLAAPANCDLYHYAGNNPVKYTDPDGNEIDISEDSNQRTILAALQRLTNDNLAVSSSGKVIITSEGTGSKTSGTKLLRYLINETDKTIKISTMDSDGTNNSITTPYKVNSDSKLDDLFNGRGLNSLILWSLGEPNITEIDSQGHISDKNCPTYITLGHELIHAYHNANGENHGYMDYGVYFNMEEEKFTKFNLELSENTLRGENGLNKRYK
ncbi:MAG: hypothetical protein IJT36_03685 [Alphaproteobacteria bacterium]|nr:hypothetical protein [Alphaproteobacteria bacterium]